LSPSPRRGQALSGMSREHVITRIFATSISSTRIPTTKEPAAEAAQEHLQEMGKMEGHHVRLRVPNAHMSGVACERKVGSKSAKCNE
ncbi:hypothetical protein COCCADRAFT_104863, partial [Bipolaris zeicola 26-R-13]